MPAKVKSVTKAQKDQGSCTKCHELLPAGAPYRYFKPGFRSRTKIRRCMKPECTPRRSELESGKMASAFEAQENALDSINETTDFDEIREILDECADAARDVLGEYEDSLSEHPMLEESVRPQIDALEEWVDSLDGFSPDEGEEEPEEPTEPERPDTEDEDELREYEQQNDEFLNELSAFEGVHQEWEDTRSDLLEAAREEARELLESLEY